MPNSPNSASNRAAAVSAAGNVNTAAKPLATVSAATSSVTASKISKTFEQLQSSPKGLTSEEAKERLTKYGPNGLELKAESKWHRLLTYFWGPLPFMIEAAALISLLLRDWPDFFVVTGLLLYNALVGFWQDNKAASALAALKKGLAPRARVLRDGQWTSIEAVDLVPGDIVTVAAGQIVPADLLLTEGEYLSCDQAALTGESLPVSKKIGDSAYSGSIAKQGSMTSVVTATGGKTFFGRTAKLVSAAGTKSHSQRAVTEVGDFLLVLAFALALILVGVQGYRELIMNPDWSWSTAGSIVQYVLVLLIASIPVALPAVMSVTMAIGAYTLSLQKAIVSRLSAIEELAGVDVLCSDKTGTLTMNELTVEEFIPFGSYKDDDVIACAALATQTSREDPIDVAVLRALKDSGVLKGTKQTAFVPFDPVSKRTLATVVDQKGGTMHYAKGAPQAISAIGETYRGGDRSLPGRCRRARQQGLSRAWRSEVQRRQDLGPRRPHLTHGPAAA
jgi:H+-transporting ATPase